MTVGNYASDFYPQNPQHNHKNPFCQQVVSKGTKETEIILIPFLLDSIDRQGAVEIIAIHLGTTKEL